MASSPPLDRSDARDMIRLADANPLPDPLARHALAASPTYANNDACLRFHALRRDFGIALPATFAACAAGGEQDPFTWTPSCWHQHRLDVVGI